MDHKSFLKSLDRETRARLNQTSDIAGLAHLAVHGGAILGIGYLIAVGAPGWPLLMIAQGVLIAFLFTLLHETCHFTPFRTRWLNQAVGAVCAALLILPPNWFRYFHFAHHRYTQDPERDPELSSPKPGTRVALALHVTGFPVLLRQAKAIWRNARGLSDEDFVPPAKRRLVAVEARVLLGIYAIVAVGAAFAPVIAFVWLIPLLLGLPFLRVYLLAEHGRCAFVADMFENTRTTFTSRVVRFIAWNMPYHAEHHACPTVPFHRLPMLHRLMRPHLKVTERGYARFIRRYMAALKL